MIFKIEGPTKLPTGRDSQMMMFDLGYGTFGGGIHYRPNIEIKYTIPATEVTIEVKTTATISKDSESFEKIACGFDKNNDKIYGLMEFELTSLPNPDKTVITECYIEIKNKNTTKSKEDIRYNLEFVDIEELNYNNIQNRDRIEFIGYEVSRDDLQNKKTHKFIFDSYSMLCVDQMH